MKILFQFVFISVLAIAISHLTLAQSNNDPSQYLLSEVIGAAGGSTLGMTMGGILGFGGGFILSNFCTDTEDSSADTVFGRIDIECTSVTRMAGTMIGASLGITAGAVIGIHMLAPKHIQGNFIGAVIGALLGQAFTFATPYLLIDTDISLSILIPGLIFVTTAIGTTVGFNLGVKVNSELNQPIQTQSNWTFDLPVLELNF